MKSLLYAFVFLVITITTTFAKNIWILKSGKLTYTVTHTFKTIKASSEKIKGKMICQQKKCNFLVATKAMDFISKDGNRDSKAWDVMKAALNPIIVVKGEGEKDTNKIKVPSLSISFAGKNVEQKNLSFSYTNSGSIFKVNGILQVNLDKFNIEKPSLFGMAIEKMVPVNVDLSFIKK